MYLSLKFDTGETDDTRNRLDPGHDGVASQIAVFVRRHPLSSYILRYRRIPPESPERGEDERLDQTDSTTTTRLVQSTLTGT
ncbi:hypothetical protein DPMN_049822 [Dreissena polymorpha]|uniref:Uncharacterized protein n=1 Tax=Dreissena polymorpha TaxID=45954 RepID=A0A9D4CF09_DREPO|nr:hypothetical protein DPMN_049822 [Dreissena polymorpha]